MCRFSTVARCSLGLAIAIGGATSVTRPTAAYGQSAALPVRMSSDSTALTRLEAAVLRANATLIARRAALTVARARLAATGFAAPVMLSTEAGELPHGIDLIHAQSLRIAVDKEFLPTVVATRARAVAAHDVAAESVAVLATERRLIALMNRALVRSVLWSAVTARLAAEDSLLASAETSLRTQFAAGNARYVDVLRLRTARLQVQTSQAAAAAEAVSARLGLDALVMDADPDTALRRSALLVVDQREVAVNAALPAAPNTDSLLAISSAAMAADIAVARVRAVRELLVVQQRPRISGFAGLQRFKGDDGQLTAGPVAGLSLSLPFTARRGNEAAVVAADRAMDGALAFRVAALADTRAGLADSRNRYEAARTRLAVFDAALLRGAREEREGALASYRTGALSLLELLDFERALAQAETDHLRARIDASDALSAMVLQAFGSGSATESSASAPGIP